MRMWLTYVVSMVGVVGVGSGALAAEPLSGEQTARAYWGVLAHGDVKEMKKFYAETVTLKAGSELLKPHWDVSPQADRRADLTIEREKLISGYGRMIGTIGRERWAKFSATIKAEQIIVERVDQDDTPIAGTKRNDLIMSVLTGPGDDRLLFVLRKGDRDEWRVIAEATDY